ncbi:hypothetical protein MBLNU457_4539t1 [Dothideomycetes sp. NU457]
MSSTQKTVGLVICSTRSPRAGPSIASLITPYLTAPNAHINLTVLDLADHPLPFFDEPLPPSEIKDPALYTHEHTRAWSNVVRPISGFVFLTPQYNWSIPAVLKNSIDFLYHEWKGKPALIVSYGSRGGGKATAALKEVCRGVRMDAMEGSVALVLGKIEGGLERAAREGVLEDRFADAWKEDLEKLRVLFGDLVVKVAANGGEAAVTVRV